LSNFELFANDEKQGYQPIGRNQYGT
jgi:hypothetical protein